MQFEFATASRIIFGLGSINNLGSVAVTFGQRALVVTKSSRTTGDGILGILAHGGIDIIELLHRENIEVFIFSINSEPTIDDIQRGVAIARDNHIDLVIGLGGGSALDAGKAISALVTNTGDPIDYLEVVGKGNPLVNPPIPYIAVPTTSGTGSEVTRNAVLQSPAHQVKVSLRHPLMLPKVALVDPELTYPLSQAVTASSGLDAFTQLLEPYVSIKTNPIVDPLCLEGIFRVARSLQRAYVNGQDGVARGDMALASLFGGLALANAGLGAVHGFAAPLGGIFHAPHGALCACLLPHVIRTNVRAMQKRQPDHPSLGRYAEVAKIITGSPKANIDDCVEWITSITRNFEIPALNYYGIQPTDFPTIIEKAASASSMKTNPIQLTSSELEEILANAF